MFIRKYLKWLVLAVSVLFGGLVYAGGGNGDVTPEPDDHPWGDLKSKENDDNKDPGNTGILGKFIVIMDWNNLPFILVTTSPARLGKDVQKENTRVKRATPVKRNSDRWLPFRR